jgi:hypothetical protein
LSFSRTTACGRQTAQSQRLSPLQPQNSSGTLDMELLELALERLTLHLAGEFL